MKKSAFLLAEEFLKLALSFFLLKFLNLVFILIYQYPWPSASQWSIFQRQFRQIMQRASLHTCDYPLAISYRNKIFEIEVDDKNRLVKRPGYEILMYDIDFFDVDAYPEGECNLYIYHDGKEFHLSIDDEN